jgi:hypothetical protein
MSSIFCALRANRCGHGDWYFSFFLKGDLMAGPLAFSTIA